MAGPLPCVAAIVALYKACTCLHETIACCRIQAIGLQSRYHQRMSIEGAAWLAVFPALPTIQATHQSASFGGSKEATGLYRVGCDPADMTGIWSWRKAPRWGRW